jgi:hypothetical protein
MAENHIAILLDLITFHRHDGESQNQSLKRVGQILGQYRSSGLPYTSSYLLQVLHFNLQAGKPLIEAIFKCHSEMKECL